MQVKQRMKAPRRWLIRAAAACVLTFVFSLSTFGTVTANTVSASVIDGEKAYTFSMRSAQLQDVLSQAQEQGMEPLGPLDVAERVGNTTTVNVRRGVKLRVTEAGQTNEFIAYKGDTVRKALSENNILVKDSDQVAPGKDMVVTADLAVEIKRVCEVTVVTDTKEQTLSLTGGTVADALREAGVKLKENDACNYKLDEPLFDKMNLRVSRVVTIRVKADGKEKEYEVAAQRVSGALRACGITLGEEDKLNVKRTDKVQDGMRIVVERVRTEEETITEEIDFTTRYEYDETMYAGEEQEHIAGEKGERTLTYKITYVDGETASRELVSEVVTKEPVQRVLLTGTKQHETQQPGLSAGTGTTPAAGTFIDSMGNTVAYATKMVGQCTAYSVPGGTTSLGLKAEYGIIAVNPNIIPYGTRMYVTSADGSVVYGYGVAGDTGGALMDGTVLADLCYNTVEECSYIGRRDMVVYLLP